MHAVRGVLFQRFVRFYFWITSPEHRLRRFATKDAEGSILCSCLGQNTRAIIQHLLELRLTLNEVVRDDRRAQLSVCLAQKMSEHRLIWNSAVALRFRPDQ